MPHLIEKRVLVLRREGEMFRLPYKNSLQINVPSELIGKSYVMCRVDSYDPEDGVLLLRPEAGIVNEKDFKLSMEVNNEYLSGMHLTKFAIITNFSNTYNTSKRFNDDIDLTERLNAKPVAKQIEPANLYAIQQPTQHHEKISKYPKEISFLDGKVSFKHFIPPLNRLVDFEVANIFIRKEFDSIKNYFSKALNLKKIDLELSIEFIDLKINSQSASSHYIDSINEGLMDKVEDLIVQDKFLQADEEKICTIQDLLGPEIKALDFTEEEAQDWLLEKLLTKQRTKHYFHLGYLSKKHLSGLANLRLTTKPISFIFLIESEVNYFLVWETYNTMEATYVWRMSRSIPELKDNVALIIESIKWMRGNTKTAFLQSLPENFIRIEHDYSGEDMGFHKWKAKLEAFMRKH